VSKPTGAPLADEENGAALAGRHRPARSYRELSQQILLMASRPASTGAFIKDIVRLLGAFTACDELDLRIRRGRRRLAGWKYDRKTDRLRSQGSRELSDATLGDPTALPEDSPPAPEAHHASTTRMVLRFGAEVWGWIDLHSSRQDFFHPAKRELYEDLALTLGAAAAYQHAQLTQRERVKELSCLHQIAQVSSKRDEPIDALMSKIAAILPPALQHADVAAACITLDEQRFTTARFDQILTAITAPIVIAGRDRGHVTVGYTKARATLDDGPFLDEERTLLEAAASEIGRIWEQSQAGDERGRLQDQLRHADRLATIGQLAAGVAHELNEPLGSILGFAQLASKTPDLPDQTLRDLTRIAAAALHSREIVRKLSLFARQAPARREPMDLSRVVEEGLFLLESRCQNESIDLSLDLEESLPTVIGDSGQMTQVLMNVVVNAIQSMPEGGDLRIATTHRGDTVGLTVSDTGGGIPPESLARIFEPFYTTKDVGEGTGLGLSVVHGIVSAHGGRIQVESNPGEGTNFTVEIPVERDDDDLED